MEVFTLNSDSFDFLAINTLLFINLNIAVMINGRIPKITPMLLLFLFFSLFQTNAHACESTGVTKSAVVAKDVKADYNVKLVIWLVGDDSGQGHFSEGTVNNMLKRSLPVFESQGINFEVCEYKYINSTIMLDNPHLLTSGFYPHEYHLEGFVNYYMINPRYSNFAGSASGAAGTFPRAWGYYSDEMPAFNFCHEIGHLFDLWHTFTPGCYEDCQNTGDYVCDTPPDPYVDQYNQDKEVVGYTYAAPCKFKNYKGIRTSCDEYYTDEGFEVPYGQNMMSYYIGYECSNQKRFTNGQGLRMRNMISQHPEIHYNKIENEERLPRMTNMVVNGDNTLDIDVIIDGIMQIDSGDFEIKNCNVYFTPEAQIVVNHPATLKLDNANLTIYETKCDLYVPFWNGISVKGDNENSGLRVINNSSISRARINVDSSNVQIEDANIIDSRIVLNLGEGLSKTTASNFENTSVYSFDGNHIIQDCIFENEKNFTSIFGSELNLINNTIEGDINIESSNSTVIKNNLIDGGLVVSFSDILSIDNNIFDHDGIEILSVDSFKIVNNEFNTVNRTAINCFHVGAVNTSPSVIKNNVFNDCAYGVLIPGVSSPYGKNDEGLVICCNEFYNTTKCDINVLVDINNTIGDKQSPAGNVFSGTGEQTPNSFNYPSRLNTLKYYSNDDLFETPLIDITKSGLEIIIVDEYVDKCNPGIDLTAFLEYEDIGEYVYADKFFNEEEQEDYDYEIDEEIRVAYGPNPTSDYLEFGDTDFEKVVAEIYSLNGDFKTKHAIELGPLDISALQDGIYVAKFKDNLGRIIQVSKIVKQS